MLIGNQRKLLQKPGNREATRTVLTNDLVPRLLDIYLVQAWREKRPIRTGAGAQLDPGFVVFLAALQKRIADIIPCSCVQDFPGLPPGVECESRGPSHGETHQSSQFYQAPATDFFGKLFSKTIPQSCRWKGNFKPSMTLVDLKATVEAKLQGLATTEDILALHLTYLCAFMTNILTHITFPRESLGDRGQYNTSLTSFKPLEICIGCLLNYPSIPLSCGHSVCEQCCQEWTPKGKYGPFQ